MSSGIDVRDLLVLASVPGIGGNRLRSMVNHFGSPSEALRASAPELACVEGIDRKLASAIVHHADGPAFADEQLSRLNKANAAIVTLWDPAYPSLLASIYDPPPMLFVCGTLEPSDRYAIGIVGTRHPTLYGKTTAEKFAADLAARSITVVSGLARGIDTAAHASALRAGGRTVAVIGSALDMIYPAENRGLAERVAESGAVVSEFFMGTKADPGNFPRRNRIISGMSLGTVIVESAEDGGAMITASMAIDQNRELFCVPGNIDQKFSAGTNRLIREGQAKLVTGIDDIIVELDYELRPILQEMPKKTLPQLTVFEQKIVDALDAAPVHIDAITELTGLSPADTLVALLGLEFKGVVRQLPGKLFLKTE
ncbi:MAG: DNA-processing protein DprA [Acidobacteriota bacterium]